MNYDAAIHTIRFHLKADLIDRLFCVQEKSLFNPSYPNKPIRSISALAKCLNEDADFLGRLAEVAWSRYRHVPQLKKDGTARDTYDAFRDLKRVQGKIVNRILKKVSYPIYLHGGIRDYANPRSIYSNAKTHCGYRVIVLMDIKDFYPSISAVHVENFFKFFFKFSDDVSKMLAKLTTKDGVIPQGAKTSSYLSNLVFWDLEGQLHQKLEDMGFRYSRFADDITISSPIDIDIESEVISLVVSMLRQKSLVMKRSKFHIRRKGQALSTSKGIEALTVTGLTVSANKVGIARKERQRIRASVKQFEDLAQASNYQWSMVESYYRRAMGRVGRLVACGYASAEDLKRRLNQVRESCS